MYKNLDLDKDKSNITFEINSLEIFKINKINFGNFDKTLKNFEKPKSI